MLVLHARTTATDGLDYHLCLTKRTDVVDLAGWYEDSFAALSTNGLIHRGSFEGEPKLPWKVG